MTPTARTNRGKARRAFTLIELLVVIAIIALLIGILLPALGAARTTSRKLKDSTQLRSIHQACIIFGDQNRGWFPGRDRRGDIVGLNSRDRAPLLDDNALWEARVDHSFFTSGTGGDGGLVTTRFAILLNEEYLTPAVLVSPGDPTAELATDGILNLDLAEGPPNHSYAGLEQIGWPSDLSLLPEQKDRVAEWKNSGNPNAVLFADRSLSATPHFNRQPYYSVWTEDPGPGKPNNYQGAVVRADNSTTFESSHIIENLQYGRSKMAMTDDIFWPIDTDAKGNLGVAMLVWN